MIGGPLTAHNWSAYGHISTDMIMCGDFSASHGSVKVIWDELRYSRRMRRLDRSSMLLLKVAPCLGAIFHCDGVDACSDARVREHAELDRIEQGAGGRVLDVALGWLLVAHPS